MSSRLRKTNIDCCVDPKRVRLDDDDQKPKDGVKPRLTTGAACYFINQFLVEPMRVANRNFDHIPTVKALRVAAVSKLFTEATALVHKNQIVVLAFHSDRISVISVAARRQELNKIPLKYEVEGVEALKAFLSLTFYKNMDVAIIFCNEGCEFKPRELVGVTKFLLSAFTGRFLWTCGRQVHQRHKKIWAGALPVLELLKPRLYIAYGTYHQIPYLEGCKFHQLIVCNVHKGLYLTGLELVDVNELTFEGTSEFLRYLSAPLPCVKLLSFWLGPWDNEPRTPFKDVFLKISEFFPSLEIVKLNDRCFLDAFQPIGRTLSYQNDPGYETLKSNFTKLSNVFKFVKEAATVKTELNVAISLWTNNFEEKVDMAKIIIGQPDKLIDVCKLQYNYGNLCVIANFVRLGANVPAVHHDV
ncbi:unnamed protein product [Bursaphelenchus okinawaensis]|uniref:Uncharacterized protein n=1 Tax=Bursaphelenchus okinawaensis TaxID=465554 RepID=A0A811L152_9BILA|nr:unnamed protein product [Bursaphelenchus okinawaensis]CAG9115635.1 unnamed protein product [Bursaphelenchus okinawaensis]